RKTRTGFNIEVEQQIDGGVKKKLERIKSIEVGNIFHLGSKYADAFGISYLDKEGNRQPVMMGSYGIGISRLLGTIAEISNDEHGLIWPKAVAPFGVYLIDLSDTETGEKLAKRLEEVGLSVLYDNRDEPAGAKLVEADL